MYRHSVYILHMQIKTPTQEQELPVLRTESDSYQHGLICRLNPIQRPTEGEWKDLARYILACHNHRKELTGELLVYY